MLRTSDQNQGMEYPVEPAFTQTTDSPLFPDRGPQSEATAQFLAHAIARNPADLRSHVQRLHLHRVLDDRPRMLAALLDLFISLKDKGLPLRRRLLDQVRPLLDAADARYFHRRLEQGVCATDPMPQVPETLLSKGVIGCTEILHASRQRGSDDRDYLAEARSFMEYGELALALQTLEEAIIRNPIQRALHTDLLEIYQYTEDRQKFREMVERLRRLANPYPEMWREEVVFATRRDSE